MKSLTLKIVLPLTIISSVTLTKWWYASPVDAPDTMFTGFPLPFVCDGWHTSLSLQIFIVEFFVDLLTYFVLWLVIVYCFNRYVIKLKAYKTVTICLWMLSGLIIAFVTLLAANPDNLYYVKRPFKMDILDTGIHFGWNPVERPNFQKQHIDTRRQQ